MMRPSLNCTCGTIVQLAAAEEQAEEIREIYQEILPKLRFVCPNCGKLLSSATTSTPQEKPSKPAIAVVENKEMKNLLRRLDKF